MVGDLFHAGHVELLRAAGAYGDWLIVGVLADETAEAYKRPPIMTLAERVAVIEAGRYVDEVIAGAPFHDLTPEGAEGVYGAAIAAGKLQYVPRTSGISTTDLIQRVIDAKTNGSLG